LASKLLVVTFQKNIGQDGKEVFPDTRYQKKIKVCKDGTPSGGQWLDSGKKDLTQSINLSKRGVIKE
jgi:hypothetical protein